MKTYDVASRETKLVQHIEKDKQWKESIWERKDERETRNERMRENTENLIIREILERKKKQRMNHFSCIFCD